jgi:hypothetical protein
MSPFNRSPSAARQTCRVSHNVNGCEMAQLGRRHEEGNRCDLPYMNLTSLSDLPARSQ